MQEGARSCSRSAAHTRRHAETKCTWFQSRWDGTCNPRCLPGLDLPVDSFFFLTFFLKGGRLSENIRGTGNLTGISCINKNRQKKLLLSSLCSLSLFVPFFDSLDIQDLMCSFCLVGKTL